MKYLSFCLPARPSIACRILMKAWRNLYSIWRVAFPNWRIPTLPPWSPMPWPILANQSRAFFTSSPMKVGSCHFHRNNVYYICI